MSSLVAPLPKVLSRNAANAPRSICIVAGELSGLDVNGGIGTANLGLATALANAGHRVRVLYTRVEKGVPHPSHDGFLEQKRQFADRCIDLQALDHPGPWDDWLGKSHRVLNALCEQSFDTVVFSDTHGNGYIPALAKRTGLAALAATRLVVVAHSASQWIYDVNEQSIANISAIKQIEIERRSLELADCVISPSAYLLETYRDYGWALPENSYVHPNILPFSDLPPKRIGKLNGAPDELVFFGRLETRKGLWLFCNALERLKDQLAGRCVTFLGKSVPDRGRPSALQLLERAASWPFEIRLLPEYDSPTALAYLARRRCVAVMPSFAENSPCAIAECLAVGIPFIATLGSGTEELVAVSDRSRCLVEPKIEPLTARLREVLDKGLPPARPAGNAQRQADHLVCWLTDRDASQTDRKTVAKPAPCLLLWPQANAKTPSASDRKRALQSLPKGSDVKVLTGDRTDLTSVLNEAGGRMIIVSEPTISIPSAMIERASACLAANTPIAAISGQWDRDNLLLGPTEGTMAVARESNGGLAFFRAGEEAALLETPLKDPVNDRLFPVMVWLHRVFARLMARGQKCELLPDLFAERRAGDDTATFEAFDALLEPADADQGLSHVIEMAQASAQALERRKAAMSLFDRSPNATKIVEGLRTTGDTRIGMANLAQSLGHPEIGCALAGDLIAGPSNGDPVRYLRSAAYEISLFELAADDQTSRINLNHSWSYKLLGADREIEIHANPGDEGRAQLRFDDVDLSRSDAFEAEVRLPHTKSKPAVCRVEIATQDRNQRVADQVTLHADGQGYLRIPIPKPLRTRCLINLSVSMAFDSDSPHHCWVRWVDPILRAEAVA